MEKFTFFPYSWHLDEDEEDITAMRVYGLDSNNDNVCVRIDNFTPFVYLELPEHIPWTASKAQMLGDKIDALLGDQKPLAKKLMFKKRLYYAHLTPNGKRKTFPYLFVSFSHQSDIRNMSYKIRRPINIMGIGPIKLKMHEQDASPILQFISYRNVSTAGWIDFMGTRIPEDEQITRCKHEFKVKWKHVSPNTAPTVACPLIMGFDIEVNSSNPSAMPKADKPGDKVFQISCVLFRHGDDESKMDKYLLTLGEPDPKTVGEDTEILMYGTESDLLVGYTEFIQEKNPNIICGYNILNFDIPYMIERSKTAMCIDSFDQQGFNKYGHAKEKTIKWSSSAYGNQTFQFLDAEGRLYVDLLPLVKRDYKMDNYKLKTISTHFLGATKDPLSVKGIFKCYRIGIKNSNGVYTRQAQKAMGIVGKYCCCENTRVSGKHGSIPIEKLYGENLEVLSWNEKTDKLEISVQSNFFDNGKKECIELELEDGRTMTCTPDHKLVTENGWVNADDIPIGGKVKVGPILPEVELDTNETIYARVLGYMITDGHISKNVCVVYIGNMMDAQLLAKDIETLSGIHPNIRKNGNCWEFCLPKNIRTKILSENWIKGGNRTESNELLPDVSKWSKPQIREFIAGMFGGDGWCPCYNKGDDKFTPIGFTQSRNNKDNIEEYMNRLSDMLKMFDIDSSIRIARRDNLFIGSLSVSMYAIEKFVTTIGYRYCYHKTIRSSIATFYYRIKNKAINGYKQFYDQVITSNMSIAKAYREYVNHYTYVPTYETMKSWVRKGFPDGRPDQPCRSFPKVGQFLNRMNVMELFEGDNYHSYSLGKNDDTLPTFELSLILKKSVGIKQVYDITVENTHSFLANGIVAHNCVQDSALVIRLFNKLQTWIGLCEMAKTCNVPIFYLYTQGQQIKVYSQLYKYCMYKNFVVEKDGYVPKDNEHYVGATVFEPIAGVYDRVLPFDFASLYPTTIIAYNIDYSTLVIDPNIPDSDCHVMEWQDCIGCEHDKTIRKTKPKHVMCEKRYFRFLKEPKGVMPTVLQNLLDARAHTRKQIKVIIKILDNKDIDEKEHKMVEELIPDVLKILTNKKKIPSQRKDELKTLTEVLEKRQLAYKVSANSMYGAMGVTRGYLPFMPGAMATTAMGRKNIGIVAETIPKKFGGKLIYGDTDSNYIVFPHLETAAENWDHAVHVAAEVTKMFPAPICLEFENEIYWRFFILTKKRYMYKKCMRDGIVDEKIGKKGVLLARRDNSMFIRNAYETLIMMVFNRKTREEILFYVIDIINKLCSHFYSYKDFVVTKSIGSHGGGQVVPFINEKGQKKGKMGDYTVPLLSTDPKERERQFKLKNCNNGKDYYTHCLPAVVQLAERMRQRGQRVDPGTRLEYVISDQGGHKAKQYVKVEDAIYFSQHSSVLKLDYMYYLKLMANPFDDVLNVLYNVDDGSKNAFQKDFVLKQYKFRLNVRTKVLDELKDLIAPTVTFGK